MSDWSLEAIGNRLKDNAMPALGQLVKGNLGGAAVATIGAALGLGDTASPEEVYQNLTPENMVRLRELEVQAQEDANKLQAAMATEQTKRIEAVNATMQRELDSESTLKSGWRGLAGWAFAVAIFLSEAMFVYLLYASPDGRDDIITNLFILFTIHGTVLGLDMSRVGRERLAVMGVPPKPTLYESVKTRVGGSNK